MAEIEIGKLFLLVMARFSGLVVSAPVLGSSNFPVVAKVGLVGFMAFLVTPTLPALHTPLPQDDMTLAMWAVGELLIGLIIGFVISLIFAAVQVGGQIMDLQTGFGMMNIFNPAFDAQFPIFGFFLFIIAMLYMLLTGGHRDMIRALAYTYTEIPPGGFAAHPQLLWEAASWGRSMFVDGLMISAPVAAAMFLAYATLGLLGRAIPQLHLFVIGFPITISGGLLLTAMMLGVYVSMLDGMFFRTWREVSVLIRGLG